MTIEDFISVEISSRKTMKERRIDELLGRLENGDTLIVSELSCLGRSLGEIFRIVDSLIKKQVRFIAVKQNMIINGRDESQTKVMITMFGLFAEIERDLLSERTKMGLANAKAKGKKLGRPEGSLGKHKLDGKEEEIRVLLSFRVAKAAIAREFGISRTCLVDFVKKRNLEGFTPPFIVQGEGPTVIGRTVLTVAITLFIVASFISIRQYWTVGFPWLLWYGAGLSLFAVGLTGVFLQHAVGSPVGWIGRFSQYTGAVYLFLGVLSLTKSASEKGMPLGKAVQLFFEDAEANYKALVQTASDGIISLDHEGKVLLWNLGAERLFGFTTEESEFFQFEAVVRNREGRLFPVAMSVSSRGTTSGVITICIISDISDRKQAEEKLRESEHRLALAASGAQIGMFEWDIVTGETDWNEQLARLLGIPITTILEPYHYEDWAKRVHPEDLPRIENELHRCMSENVPYRAEYRVFWADQSVHWIAARGVFEYDDQGKPKRMRGIVMDITQRKQVEEALELAYNTLGDAQKIAHLGSFEYFPATGTTKWSEEQYRIHGLDPSEPSPTVDEILKRCIHPKDAAMVYEVFCKAVQSNSIYEQEHRLIWPDGSEHWVRNLAYPYFDENGELVRYVGTTLHITDRKRILEELQKAHDELEVRVQERTAELMAVNVSLMAEITERRRAEEALRESEESYRLLIETANEGIWTMDADQQTTYVNQAMADMLGYAPSEMIGRSVDEFFFSEDMFFHQERMKRRHAGEDEVYERRFRKRDGSPVWTLVSAKALKSSEGDFAGSFAMFTDITKRKQAEEEQLRLEQRLQQARKAESLGRMAGAIAHHMNNQLGVVVGSLELARLDLPQDSKSRADIAEAMAASRRVADIGRSMLAYLGQTIGTGAPVSLDDICPEALRQFTASLSQKIRLKLDTAEDGPTVRADAVQIRQALTNPVMNAGESIATGEGEVVVAVRVVPGADIRASRFYPPDWEPKDESYASLSVLDTGSGMDRETLEKAFDPFFSTKLPAAAWGWPWCWGPSRLTRGLSALRAHPAVAVFSKCSCRSRQRSYPWP